MSQSYVIRVSAAVREEVRGADKRTKSLVLTEIVPAAEQREILREKLRAAGWEADDSAASGDVLRRRRGEVTETIDLETLTVEATVSLERSVERSRTITVRGDRDLEDSEERRKREKAALERSIAISDDERREAEAAIQREIADALDASEEERGRELNELVREVYAESLKRKAARLGSITGVQESRSGEDYELVIKVTE